MDSKSIRNHRSVSEDESQRRYEFSLLQSFPEGKRKSYHVRKKQCVGGQRGLMNALYRKLRLEEKEGPFRQFILFIPSSHKDVLQKHILADIKFRVTYFEVV
jgi:hypothetical protein